MAKLRNWTPERIDGNAPPWPGNGASDARAARIRNGGGRVLSLSERHAAQAWETARASTLRRAPAIARNGPGARHRSALLMASLLANHVVTCERCNQTGHDTQTPEAWLIWAAGKWAPLADVLSAAIQATRGATIPAAPPGITRRP